MTVAVVNSGGALNHVSSHIVREAIALGLLDQHLAHLRSEYGRRINSMHAALEEQLGGRLSWLKPGGGYFFWLEMAPGTDTAALREKATQCKTGFQPGRLFSSMNGLDHCLRLSFAHYGSDDITRGVQRLAQALE